MADRKALGRAAKNAITSHIVDLTTVTEANLEKVILSCEQEKLIMPTFKGTLLDRSTGQSTRERARKLVDHIQNSVEIVPNSLDTFLFVLVDTAEGSLVTEQVAADVAATCKCHHVCMEVEDRHTNNYFQFLWCIFAYLKFQLMTKFVLKPRANIIIIIQPKSGTRPSWKQLTAAQL